MEHKSKGYVPQSKIMEALNLVERLATMTTPEEDFEALKNEDGVAEDDGITYDDVDEMVSDMSDDRLCDEYGAFMSFVREAKTIVRNDYD